SFPVRLESNRRRRHRQPMFLLTAALLLQAGARPTHAELRRFDATLDSLRQQLDIPGLSAAIVYDDSVIWSRGYGFADVERKIRATPHTPYEIASVSKPFAAVVLLRLAGAGKVSLDDPMSKWSSDYKTDSVHVRHVLSHTSEGVPGTAYNYNGNLYANLFDVVVKGSARRYREILSNDILVPLGMTETAPGNDLKPGQANMEALLGKDVATRYGMVALRDALAYDVDSLGHVARAPEPDSGLSPASGIISTVLDLAKFDAAIDHRLLLSDSMTPVMWTNARPPDGHAFPYALGWFVQEYRGERLIWHNGNLIGRYSALYLKRPGARLTLLLLANSDALSMPFKLALGDVTQSAFACAFLAIAPVHQAPTSAPACAEESRARIAVWRAAHRLAP